MALFLSREDVASILKMRDAIEAVEMAFKEQGLGTISTPVRQVIALGDRKATFGFMPAYLREMDSLGVKVVSSYPQNPVKYNLPTTQAVVLLGNPEDGTLLAIMDGTLLTAMRTGAATGVATKYLARKDANELGVIGTGVQARTQVAGVCEVRTITRIKAYDVAADRAQMFCKEVSKDLGVEMVSVKRPEDAVRASDIVVTATTSKTPVLSGEWLEQGMHVNAIGSHTPDARELDTTAIRRSKIVVDSREAALKEAGDILIPISEGIVGASHIHAELGEILAGRKAARESESEITIFKSQGLAIQDVSTARRIYEIAAKNGIGRTLTL